MRVRIVVVNNFFPPRTDGSAHPSESLAQGYAAAGHHRQLGVLPPQPGQLLPLGLRQAPLPCPRACRSAATQLPRLPSLIPSSRATCAIGRPVSRTMRTAPSRNSASNLRRVSAMNLHPLRSGLHAIGGTSQFLDCPVPEVARLGRTLAVWRKEVLAYFGTYRASNGPTEAVNLLIEKIRRIGHGYRRFDHYRLRLLLHCGIEWPTLLPPRIRRRRLRFVA
jgi:hypothetical protein